MSIVTELDLLKYRRTKIVATVGPASNDPARLRELIEAGVNVFRVNMSHGAHEEHALAIERIRAAAAELDSHTAILADLCGPKIRTGHFADGPVTLSAGSRVTITTADVPGSKAVIPSQYSAITQDVAPGHPILLNDGAVELRADSVAAEEIQCTVIAGGVVGDHKGINLPGSEVSAPSLTDKDRLDAAFALAQDVDFLALSFVRRAEDVIELRRLVEDAGKRTQIVAKIEKPEALRNSEEILHHTDAIMVARGDLGVELNPEQVPLAQTQLINRARELNRPVIVATQMLESMITNARPTRAEVSDVAFAVACSADAVMLSGESAVGEFPVEAVAMMDKVARQTESYYWHTGHHHVFAAPTHHGDGIPFGDAIADATAKLVAEVKARAVIVISQNGTTAATISAARPAAPVVAISNQEETCRCMSLMWGMVPHLDAAAGRENPNQIARRIASEIKLAETGDFIVMVRGFHADPQLNTPSITLLQL